MPRLAELLSREGTEDHLWEHRLYLEDVYDVIEEDNYKVFPDPPYDDRLMIIGRDRGNRLLTIIVTEPDEAGRSYVVTAWPSSETERALYGRPGGRTDV